MKLGLFRCILGLTSIQSCFFRAALHQLRPITSPGTNSVGQRGQATPCSTRPLSHKEYGQMGGQSGPDWCSQKTYKTYKKMDNRDTFSLMNKKKMDANTVWQWRIMHAKKYSRHPQPFSKIGLDFSVASNTKKKLDLQLVTNGIIFEVCDFAKTINKSKRHFITNILENNFDLGLENEQQRNDFTAQILHKVKDLIKNPPKDENEVFSLFDTSTKPDCNTISNNGLNVQSTELKFESLLVEMDETDDSEYEDDFMSSQATSKENIKTESLSQEMDGAQGNDCGHEDELKSSGAQSTEELKEDVLPPSFPHCEKISLNLDVGSKQSLDQGLLTKGVMLELVHFTKVLTASYSTIVLGVLEHNFELDLKSHRVKNQVWCKISHLLKRRKEFKNEPFFFQTNSFKRPRRSALSNNGAPQSYLNNKPEKRALSTTTEQITKRRRIGQFNYMETDTLSHQNDLCTSGTAEGDCFYTCPLEDSDLDTDEVTESVNTVNQDHLKNTASSDIPESSFLDIYAPLLNSTDISSSLPIFNLNMNPPFTSQPDKRELCGGEEPTWMPKNVTKECDMEQKKMGTENNYACPLGESDPHSDEVKDLGNSAKRDHLQNPTSSDMEKEETGTENNIWKLRANRVKQILNVHNKELGPFTQCQKYGLEFNVGLGPKQSFSVTYLRNSVLLEVAKFALAINLSQQEFIMEILEHNFDFSLQNEHHRNVFTCELMNRVRQLRNCEDAIKFSNDIFDLPSTHMANQSMDSVNPELGSKSRMEECDVAPACPPDSQAETKEHISQKSVELYPFCKELGLRLYVNKCQPNKKLDINKMTNGAMTEVTNFAETLCGTFEEIFLDILRHNFDLDLQSGDSDLTKGILELIPFVMEQKNIFSCITAYKKTKGTKKDPSKIAKLDCQTKTSLDACSTDSSQAAIIDQNVASTSNIEYQDEYNLKLWKLRANQVQRILSVPHEEHCPLYSYSRCKKLGIDFNVGSGVKRNFDPKLLTNGIMVELNTFATAMLSSRKDFITEIMESNFNLDLKNERDRIAFGEKNMIKVNEMLHRRQITRQLAKPFQLPDMKCIKGFTYVKTTFCPKCLQDRNHKPRQYESDPGRMHHPRPHIDPVSADANCTAQKPIKDPSSTFSTAEETIMNMNHRCKKIGLNLFVDKDQPQDKLDTHVLTCGVMNEVALFAKRICGTKNKIITDLLEHNFNIGMQSRNISPPLLLRGVTNDGPAWFNKVFVIQTKKRRATLRSHKISVMKSKQNWCSRGSLSASFLTSADVSSSLPTVNLKWNPQFASQPDKRELCGGEEQTQMPRNLTKEFGMEQEKMGTENNYTCPLGESDLDSDEVTDSENTANQDHLQNPTSSDMEQEEMGTENNYSCHLGQSDLDLDKVINSENIGNQDHLQNTTSSDMEKDKTGTENNMWKLRANRVKQILNVHNKELGPFIQCHKFGLEFNIGLGPKQSISVDSLSNSKLLEVAKFALAINSSQQDFIMEILEHNFDFSLQNEHHRNVFTCELMNRVRQLRKCEDAIKFSNEIFELPGHIPLTHMANQSMDSVNPELGSKSRMEECDVAPACPPDSQAETKEHISQKSVELYPFCKELGLRLYVNKCQPNKKLDINKMTNGAMTEVTNFAETLCGTFEEIFLDILRHNFDLDLQSGDSDLTKDILERIPFVMKKKNIFSCVTACKKIKSTRKDPSKITKLDCQKTPNIDACSTDFSQAAIIDQNVASSPDTEHQDELSLKLWKLRANQIQRILSVPHEENCPLYSYSRCKKLGIDFNVGSGVKTNLEPRLLTNGIMVELNTFATAMLSSRKDFITEILECNFNLDLKNELDRDAFTQHTMIKILPCLQNKHKIGLSKKPFELPDINCKQGLTYVKPTYCPKCYQQRKLRQYESDPGQRHHPHPHTMTDTLSVDANCTAQNPKKDPSSTFSATEETIMDTYHGCKKIGLNLFVDKDQPQDKLDKHVLTRGIMNEVASFAKTLCGTKSKTVHAVLEHNFNIGIQGQDVNPLEMFCRALPQSDGSLVWFNKVFVIQPVTHRQPGQASNLKEVLAMQAHERKETIKKRRLALQTKEERAMLPSPHTSDVKSKKNPYSKVNHYPICTEIGLDLDLTSKSGEKEKLDLKLLTRAVVFEIHKFATSKARQYFHGILYDILDYNFDLSSQHYRHWEFSVATASMVQAMVKVYHKKRVGADKIFKLPFVFPKDSQRCTKKRQNEKCKKNANEDSLVHHEDTVAPTEPWPLMQMNAGSLSVSCGSTLQGDVQIKVEEYDPHYGIIKPELDTVEKYYPHHDDVKTESNAEDVEYLFPGEPAGFLGYTSVTMCPNSESNMKSGNEDVKYYFQTESQNPHYYDVKTESNAEDIQYLVQAEAAGSLGYSMVIIGQGNESTLIKEEQENVPTDSYH